MTKETGGQAFPYNGSVYKRGHFQNELIKGMTLRDYFAGQVIAGLIGISLNSSESGDIAPKLAKASYQVADLMLTERAK